MTIKMQRGIKVKEYKIIEINNNILKQKIAKDILDNSPEWFGNKESVNEYISNIVNYPFIGVYDKDEAIGFYSLRPENKNTLDMYVLGIKKKYHRQGIGTNLQKYANEYAKKNGYKFLIVLTLSKAHKDKGYKATRDFYHKNEFVDIYESDKIWDKNNPTQIMVLKLS